MAKRLRKQPPDELRQKIIGLGERSLRKSYYPQLLLKLEEVRKARDEAILASKAKTEFINIASHELRTPVTSIRLLVDLNRRLQQSGRAFAPGFIDRLDRLSRRLQEMVDRLLDLSRLERGTLKLDLVKADLCCLVRTTTDDYRLIEPNRVIDCTTPGEPIWIRMDPSRLQQVLDNLLDNAVKYSPQQSSITVTVSTIDAGVRVSVADQGIGIDPAELERIFSPFYRVQHDAVQAPPGLGLGLYVARQIVSLHQGTMGAKSDKTSGSVFYFELPIAPDRSEEP